MDCGVQVNLGEGLLQDSGFSFDCDFISGTEKGTNVTSVSTTSVKTQTNLINSTTSSTNTDISELFSIPVIPFLKFGDKQFKSFCGVSREFFDFLLFLTSENLSESRNISKETKILLLLVKFKLNVSFAVLSSFFGLCEKTTRKLFYVVLDAVFNSVKDFVIWLDKPTIQARMPNSFKAFYPKTRAIIDASEIECERPKTVHQRVQMYSSYKSRFTVKFLVAIAPSGEITFISKCYGGRTTDTEITVKSGFIELIEPGDVILADKGFPTIETELNEAGGILIMPPFKSGSRQFTQSQNKDGYECSSVRIHVERAIARLKIFEILNFLPVYLLPHIDKILRIICFFCNCFPDLIQM